MTLGFRRDQNRFDNTLGVLGIAELCLHRIDVAHVSHSSRLVVGKILGQDSGRMVTKVTKDICSIMHHTQQEN